MSRPSAERLAQIRAFADGEWATGEKKIPADMPLFTRDLLAEIDALRGLLVHLRECADCAESGPDLRDAVFYATAEWCR